MKQGKIGIKKKGKRRISIRKFKANKRGISSLFIAIYIALLVVVLVSALFVGLSISNSSLNSYLRTEQNRSQESILIGGGDRNLVINVSTSMITSLLVNNTGAITARIRALYIGERFVCDPSKLPGDSYISPQNSLKLNLSSLNPPLTLNDTTLFSRWVITTERGSESENTGLNLLFGPPINQNDPDRVYFGPLLLIYSMFHWSNDGGNTWHSGWTIPNGNGNVIWRILIANIDKRDIILSSASSFALIQNSQQPNKIATWLIGPNNLNPLGNRLQSMQYYFIYFSVNGPNSLSNMFTPNPISSNFITFMGNFVETGGTLTPFGQTIPFEAVLVT